MWQHGDLTNEFPKKADLCSDCFKLGYTISEFIKSNMLMSSIGALSFCTDVVHGVGSSCLCDMHMHLSSMHLAQLKAAAIYLTLP